MYCVDLNPTPDFGHFDHVADGKISESQEDFGLRLGSYSGRHMEMGEVDSYTLFLDVTNVSMLYHKILRH